MPCALAARRLPAPCFGVAASGAGGASDVGALTGTLKTVKDTATIRLGFRESSLPFSYLQQDQAADRLLDRSLPRGGGGRLDRTRRHRHQDRLRAGHLGEPLRQGEGRRSRSRMRLDHPQCAATEGGRVLADLLRCRDQADGAEGLRREVLSRSRRQDRRRDRRHHQRGRAEGAVGQAKAQYQDRFIARSRAIRRDADIRRRRRVRDRRRAALWLHRQPTRRPRT